MTTTVVQEPDNCAALQLYAAEAAVILEDALKVQNDLVFWLEYGALTLDFTGTAAELDKIALRSQSTVDRLNRLDVPRGAIEVHGLMIEAFTLTTSAIENGARGSRLMDTELVSSAVNMQERALAKMIDAGDLAQDWLAQCS